MIRTKRSPSCITETRLKVIGPTKPNGKARKWDRAERLLGLLLKLSFLKRQRVEPVRSPEDRVAAERLLYREYIKRGYCSENSLGLHFHYHSLLPACKTLCIKHRSTLFGTVSIILDSPAGLPFGSLFPEELAELRRQNRRVAEIGLLALDGNNYRKGSYSLRSLSKMRDLFDLFRAVFTYSHHVARATDLVILVHPRHEELYRYIGFTSIAPACAYSGAEGNAALPMKLCLSSLQKDASTRAVARYLLAGTDPERLAATEEYRIGDLLMKLSEHPTVWPKMGEGQRRYFLGIHSRIALSANFLDSIHRGSAEAHDAETDVVRNESAAV